MNPTWLSTAAMDPTWLGIVAAIGALGLIATAIALVRQAAPPTRVDRERVARRRGTTARLAH
ncbi:hypothetical protein [Agrococcus sp. ProA11]|uniref:hypothetical protein n=1 Tax=Agrococcus chionoecetis TaxID=3153752 RepID=UPI0032609F21